MNFKQCALALDFDGVVWDSVGESCFVACQAWEQMRGPVPPGLEPRFRAGRWLVRTGHDFFALIALLLADPAANPQQFDKDAFKSFLEEHRSEADQFDGLFYRIRDEERETHPDAWVALQPPYAAFMAAYPALQSEFGYVSITTTKDEASVHFLLSRAGISLPVLGKAFSRDKDVQVRKVAELQGIPLSQVVLLDDLLDNLLPVRAVGARVALATWGYNTPTEHEAARGLGITLAHADTMVADLQRALET